MPLTITHTYNSSISDDPIAAALGKVIPSRWNNPHSVSGNLLANEVINIPAGVITSTDVQAALNQLASLIPAPGPGTDPLTLIHGLSVTVDNPAFTADPTNKYASVIQLTTDCSTTRPTFANNEALWLNVIATNGQNTNGGITTAKQSFYALYKSCYYNASGQKNVTGDFVQAYGMGDSSIGQQFVFYAGGPVNGDEGQGFRLVCALNQQGFLTLSNITSVPTQSTVNTTTTQAIVGSKDVQTVNVVSTAGAVNGDWVVVEQQQMSGSANLEAVQIISFTPTSITGVFVYNHNNGVTITPALRLFCDSTFQMGQDRVLINLSQPAYTTGTITTIAGAGVDGALTTWADNMVGGNALNIGVISFDADDYTAYPFNGTGSAGPLKSWYQILQVTSPTHLVLYSFSVAADASYHGFAPGAGGYTIRPAARVLRLIANSGSLTGEIICETSTSTWSVGDHLEQAICPYADVTGFNYQLFHWTPGGAGVRSFMIINNRGARTIESCFEITNLGTFGQPTADTVPWNIVFNIGRCNIGINCSFAQQLAIRLGNAGMGGGITDAAGVISWSGIIPYASSGGYLAPNSTNSGMDWHTMLGSYSGDTRAGKLRFAANATGINPDANLIEMLWGGYIYLPMCVAGLASYILMDNNQNPTDTEQGFLGFVSNVLTLGTKHTGGALDRDVAISIGAAEQMRWSGGIVKYSNAASFTANDTTATSLTSVGPVGAHTTVQKWLTIKDDAGATFYIPCF